MPFPGSESEETYSETFAADVASEIGADLFDKPDVKDGRFGYQNIYRNGEQKFLSLEEAVSLHNGYAVMRNHYRTDPMFNNGSLSLALQTRLVDNASVQKTRDGSLVAQNRYVKFVEDEYVR